MIRPELRELLRQWNPNQQSRNQTRKIRVQFPDEEIGRAHHFDVAKFG
jgi:hypothetical protein